MNLFDSLKNKFNSLTDKKDDIEFLDYSENAARHELSRIKLASEVPVYFKNKQIESYNDFHFRKCPGMFDYSRLGYIIPAWRDMEFLVNKAGTVGILGQNDNARKLKLDMVHFDPNHTKHLIPNNEDESKPKEVWNIASPWKIRTKPGIHMIVLPAHFHNENLHNFNMMPGLIEYGSNFHTFNLILNFKSYGKFKITAGEPLYHIIPTYGNEFKASYGLNSDYKSQLNDIEWFIVSKNFYRRFHNVKKKFKLRKETGE